MKANLTRKIKIPELVLGLVVAASFLWAFWPTFRDISQRWTSDPRYSHGILIPAFSAFLLWFRRDQLKGRLLQPSGWGIPWLLLGLALHLAGARVAQDGMDALSVPVVLTGLALCLGGRPALRWTWPAIAYLVFMVPLPYRLESALAYPLQRSAAVASTWVLQLLGCAAVNEGYAILLNDVRLSVIGDCNGLGMLVSFVALCTAVALLGRRPWLDRLMIVASALPISFLANVIRISLTGVLHLTVGSQVANLVFHDLAGWLMMFLALGMLGIELWLLSRLLVEPVASAEPMILDLSGPVFAKDERRAASSEKKAALSFPSSLAPRPSALSTRTGQA